MVMSASGISCCLNRIGSENAPGRVVVAENFRGKGLSHTLIENAVAVIQETWPGQQITIGALLAWRVNDLGRRKAGVVAKFGRALEREPIIVGLMLVGILALWLWTARDAYQKSRTGQQGGIGIFGLVLVLFFLLGWCR